VTNKNRLDFGGDPAHVTLSLAPHYIKIRITAALAEFCALQCSCLFYSLTVLLCI